MLIVQKFGGSSLTDPGRLRRAAEISREACRRGARVLVVVSAAGDTTDELIALAHAVAPAPPLREMDALIATGEQQSAALMAIMLDRLGVPARSFSGWQAGIRTEGPHGAGRICEIDPERLYRAMDLGMAAVVAGFQGMDGSEDVSTLGRGGSDTTAVALAAAMGAARCEIYTDVDGVFTADPRLVSGAQLLTEIDSRDMLALAEAGSQVLHPESVLRALEGGVDLRLLSSFRAGPGTAIRPLSGWERPPFAGVTRSAADSTVSAVGRAADEGTLLLLRQRLEAEGIPVAETAVEPGRVSLKVAPTRLHEALRLIHRELFGM